MSSLLEVPRIADLERLSVELASSDAPGVLSVTAWANDGAMVILTWDEIAASVSVRWLEAGDVRLALNRESASKVSVREENGQVEFWIWSDSDGLSGRLVVCAGEHVSVTDELLLS